MTDRYADFTALAFDRPADHVLRITLDAPGMNSVDAAMHRQLADVWLAVDRDPDTNVALLQGAGKGFSAGGNFDLIESMMGDEATRLRILREARDLVFNVINCSKPIVSAIHGPAVGAGLVAGLLADVSVVGRTAADHRRPHPARASRPATTPPSAGRCWRAWPRPSTTCSPAIRSPARRPSGSAWSRCASTTTRSSDRALEVAAQLAGGAQSAHPVDQADAQQLVPVAVRRSSTPPWPTSSSGSRGPDAREGLASHAEKRAPEFRGPTGDD